jgi:O-antigen ligase
MILALFLTLSRAGILSFLAALGVFALLCRRFRLARRRAIALSVLFLLFFFLASFTYFGWDPLLERLHPEGKVTPHRIRVWGDALRIVRDYPLLGTGLNTFAAVYPFYKSFSVRYAYPFAENDFLQLAAETGLIGLAVALGIIAVFHRPLFSLDPSQILGRRSGRRRPSLLPGPVSRRFLVAGSYAAVAALLIHSLVDFNLHIPANAFLFSTVAAIAWRTARGLGRGGGGGAEFRRPGRGKGPGEDEVKTNPKSQTSSKRLNHNIPADSSRYANAMRLPSFHSRERKDYQEHSFKL